MWEKLVINIRLDKEMDPVKGYIPYMTPVMIETIKKKLNQLELAGFIEPSKFLYASPIVCILKKDKTIQVCIDFRKVNQDIINDAYPMRRMKY